ncbi:MAG TPA: hypothetical protein VFZ59_12060 [Verrucomicrobiae bacterium]|nr:hypothetical protein [Verrucomicrobiae bacterium]
MKRIIAVLALTFGLVSAQAERINHEGRILGDLPVVTNAVLFNTTNADAVLAAMQIFPVTSPWNEDISHRPVLTNSDAMMAQISSDLLSTRRTLRAFKEMNFVLVPDNQPTVSINFFDYPNQSDLDGGSMPNGLYPIPANMPIETWPSETDGQTLSQWQQDVNDWGGDRHSIIVKPGAGFIWETWQAKLVGSNWEASNGAKFNLNTNALRPAGWTSGDAAGLPMFPALPRFDECERGVIEHALRIVVKRTRYNNYIYPATHWASYATNTSVNLPSMGQRLRLKSSFVIPANWTKQEKAVLIALKKYGAFVADNGNFFSFSVTPDDRWPAGCFDRLSTVGITNFEAIQSTGPTQGPRSPGAPTAYAGADQTVSVGVPVQLQGFVNFTNTLPTTNLWRRYSGPTNVAFANAALTNTTATFNAPGVYTLMLSGSNGVHAVAYDAVVITATSAINLNVTRAGPNVNLTWTGGVAPFVVERSSTLPATSWSGVLTTSVQNASIPITPGTAFFRVRGN